MAIKSTKPAKLPSVDKGNYVQSERLAKGAKSSVFYYFKKAVSTNLPIYEAYKNNNSEDDIKFTRRDLKAKRFFGYLFYRKTANSKRLFT